MLSRKLRSIVRSFAIGLALVFMLSSLMPGLAAKREVSWSETPMNVTLIAGRPTVKQVSFVSNKKLKNVAFEISPQLAGLVSVQPTNIPEVRENQPQPVTLTFATAVTSVGGAYTGTITVKEKVKCKEQDCSEKGKPVPDPLPVSLTVKEFTSLISGARDFASPAKVTVSGVNPSTFNPSQLTVRFDIKGATIKPDTVKVRVNEILTPNQNLQITPNSVTATLNLAEGRNALLLTAADTESRLVVSEPTLWIGGSTLNVAVLDESNLPLVGATVTAKLGDDQTVQAQAQPSLRLITLIP
jgi:hypothetical protein